MCLILDKAKGRNLKPKNTELEIYRVFCSCLSVTKHLVSITKET